MKVQEANYWKDVLDAQKQEVKRGERHEVEVMKGLVCLVEGMTS